MPAAKSRIWGAESVATLPNEKNRTDDGTWKLSQSMHRCFSWVVSLIMWSPVPSSQNCASGSNGPISKITLVCKNRFKMLSFKAIQHQLSFLEALLHPTMMAEFPFQTSWMVCYNPRSAILSKACAPRWDCSMRDWTLKTMGWQIKTLHCVSQHPPSKRLQTLELWIPCEVKVCLEF